MFNIGERDEYGKQKRIEHRGKYLRASRTGGVSLRAQTRAAGLNVTGNTSRGVRVSTRLAKGTNVALQNGRFRLRGRYGRGPTKLNLSKSGLSLSTRNALGTFNWTNPNRSSAKLFGIQMRGKKAANLQIIFLLGSLVVGLVKITAVIVVGIVRGAILAVRYLAIGIANGTQALSELARRRRASRLSRKGEERLAAAAVKTDSWKASTLKAVLLYIVRAWGRGYSAEEVGLRSTTSRRFASSLDAAIEPGTAEKQVTQMKQVTAALSDRYARAASPEEVGELLLRLDEAARRDGERTRLQDTLIDVYSDAARPLFEVEEDSDETR